MKIITVTELKDKLEKDEVVLIDVREPAEHRSECISEACLIPLGEISCERLPSRSRPIVLHCRSGKRSQDACVKLLAEDPNIDVYSLEGGIIAWQNAGFPVKNFGKKILPLDRQTQLVAGFLAFIGVVLGVLVDSNFYILSGFVGLGLMFAGFTGWCGMAKLLARMPWNK